MLSVGSLSLGALRAFNSVLILLNLEKTFLLSSCCSNGQAKKQGSAGLDKLRTISPKHQTQSRFYHFLDVTLFVVSLG